MPQMARLGSLITDQPAASAAPRSGSLSAGANAITLDNANNFSTVSVVSATNATLNDTTGIDLGASYAYSDSESDLPMLRLVGHPVAVNPDAELARVARAEGWQILRFERLGRRLRVAVAAVALGGIGSVALQRSRA